MLCDTRKDILIVDCLNAFPPLCALGSDTRNVSKQHFWMIKKNVFCSMLMVISWYGKFIHTKILVYFVMHEAGQKPVHVEYIKRQPLVWKEYGENIKNKTQNCCWHSAVKHIHHLQYRSVAMPKASADAYTHKPSIPFYNGPSTCFWTNIDVK